MRATVRAQVAPANSKSFLFSKIGVLGALHIAFSHGNFQIGCLLMEKGARQDILTLDVLDWKQFAEKAGQDTEAIDAALQLGLQVRAKYVKW